MKLHQKRLLYAGLIVLLVVIWIFYAANGPQTTAVLAGTVRAATLLALGAMCGMIGERSGVVNIGIEGQFLLSAFAAFTVASMTSSLFLGTIAGIGMGLLMGWMLAAMAVGLKVDQIIAGTVLNIAALGLTSFFYDRSRSLGVGKYTNIDLGGATGNGALIEVATEEGALCVGVDWDQWGTVPEAHPCLVTSAMKDIVKGVADLLVAAKAGTLTGGNFLGDVDIAPYHDFESMVTDEMRATIEEVRAGLADG